MNIHSECVFDDEGKYFNEIHIDINQFPRGNSDDLFSLAITEYCSVTGLNRVIQTVLNKERVQLIIQGLQKSIMDSE